MTPPLPTDAWVSCAMPAAATTAAETTTRVRRSPIFMVEILQLK